MATGIENGQNIPNPHPTKKPMDDPPIVQVIFVKNISSLLILNPSNAPYTAPNLPIFLAG